MSTGPKTEEGRKKSSENGRKPKKKHRVFPESQLNFLELS